MTSGIFKNINKNDVFSQMNNNGVGLFGNKNSTVFGNLTQTNSNGAFGNLTQTNSNGVFGNLTQPTNSNGVFGNLTQQPPPNSNGAFGNLTQQPPPNSNGAFDTNNYHIEQKPPFEIQSVICLPISENVLPISEMQFNHYILLSKLFNSNINRDIYKIIMNCENPSNIINIKPNTLFITKKSSEYEEIAFIDRSDLLKLNPNDKWTIYDNNELFYNILKIGKIIDGTSITNFYITKAFGKYLKTKINEWNISKVKDLSIDFLIICKEEIGIYLIHRLRSKLTIDEINTITTSPFSEYLDSYISKNDISIFQLNYQ